MANWKNGGPDLAEGPSKGLHYRLQEKYLQDRICQGNVPEWMVSGWAILIQKDSEKGAQASN